MRLAGILIPSSAARRRRAFPSEEPMFQRLLKYILSASRTGRRPQPRHRFRPCLEAFEARLVPAVLPTVAFTVNTWADTADANPGDGLAQDAMGQTSLRAAIQEGNATQNANIRITFDDLGRPVVLNTALPDLARNFEIRGRGWDVTAVQRSDVANTPAFRLFRVGAQSVSTIADLSLSNGLIDAGQDSGAAVFNDGNLTLSNAELANNQGHFYGGAIQNNGILTLTTCSIHDNSANNGAGLANYGSAWIEFGTEIYNNHALFNGGGIYNHMGATVSLVSNCSLYVNDAASGGAVYNRGSFAMQDGSILWNIATTGSGGGLYSDSAADTTLTRVRIEGNEAANSGGGVYVRSGTTTLDNCSVTQNTAMQVNDAAWHANDGTLVPINNCTIGQQGPV